MPKQEQQAPEQGAQEQMQEQMQEAPKMPESIDLNGLSSKAIYELLSPFFTKGEVVAIVEDCREGGSDRTGITTGYKVKVAVPSMSEKDVFGVAKSTLAGYWINANSQQEPGQVVTINLAKQVIIIGNKLLPSNELVHPKSLVSIDTVMDVEKRKLLTDRYQLTKRKTVLQGVELFTFLDTLLPEEGDSVTE